MIRKGFTLIEVLLVLVLLGIIAAISYPSYQLFLLKVHRSDASRALITLQIHFERCYSENHSYLIPCNVLPSFPTNSPLGFYNIAIADLDVATYTLIATPRGTQTKDFSCAKITINHSNVKTAHDINGAIQDSCWK